MFVHDMMNDGSVLFMKGLTPPGPPHLMVQSQRSPACSILPCFKVVDLLQVDSPGAWRGPMVPGHGMFQGHGHNVLVQILCISLMSMK